MQEVTIHLLKPGKGTTITYHGELLADEPGHLLVHARWERPPADLGYVIFEPGDHFYEHYYTERWYNIFEIRDDAGQAHFAGILRMVGVEITEDGASDRDGEERTVLERFETGTEERGALARRDLLSEEEPLYASNAWATRATHCWAFGQ